MKMLIDFWMDGYETEQEMHDACIEFVKDRLSMTASSITILWAEEPDNSNQEG